MSHFSCVVIGDNPTQQLAPYHEFECTGLDDQYVQNVDKTAEALAEYEGHTERRVQMPDGTIRQYFTEDGEYHPDFLREPALGEIPTGFLGGTGSQDGKCYTSHDWRDGRGYRTMFVQLPPGASEIEVLTKDGMPFAEWAADYYGVKILEGSSPSYADLHKYGFVRIWKGQVTVIDRTNPTKKWDWWQIGGRWRGFFKLKPGAHGVVGDPGVFDNPAKNGYVDQLRKGEIDFAGMRADAAADAAKTWDKYHVVLDQYPAVLPWKAVQAATADVEEARTIYWGQAGIKALAAHKDLSTWELDPVLVTRDAYVDEAAAHAAAPFAIVHQGQWYERGEMGWWGIVSNEKEKDEWGLRVKALLESVSDDTLLTAVDCHI